MTKDDKPQRVGRTREERLEAFWELMALASLHAREREAAEARGDEPESSDHGPASSHSAHSPRRS